MIWQRTLHSSTKLCKTHFLKPQLAVAIAATNSERRLLHRCNYYSTCTVTQSNVHDVKKLGLHRWSTWKQVGDQYLNYHLRSGHREDILYLHEQVSRSTATLHFSHNDETATGTVISPDGYIVTSAHAFGDPDKMPELDRIKVMATLFGESNALSQQAQIYNIDYRYDLAILKVDTHGFFNVPKFSSIHKNLEQSSGSLPKLTYFGRVKQNDGVGMIVAKKCEVVSPNRWNEVSEIEETIHKKDLLLLQPELEREIDDSETQYIWRNFGGPLVDSDGNVVGILNTAASGYEYAIPSELMFQMLRHSQYFGRIIGPSVGVIPVDYDGAGVLISLVAKGTPADKAGVKQGEIIRMINHQPVRNSDEMGDILYKCNSDISSDPVTLTLMDPETHAIRHVIVNLEDPKGVERQCYDEYLKAVTIEAASSSSDDDDSHNDNSQSDNDDCSSSQSDNDRDDDNDDDDYDDGENTKDEQGLDDHQETEETIKEQPNEHEEEIEENLIKSKVCTQPDHIGGLDLQKMAKDVEMIHEKVLEMAKKIEDHSTALNDHVAQFHNYSDLSVPLRELEDKVITQSKYVKQLHEDVNEVTVRGDNRDSKFETIKKWIDKATPILVKVDNLGGDLTKVVETCQCHEEQLKNKADLSYVDNLKWEVTRVK